MYKNLLEEKLSRISVPECVLQCRDVKCRNMDHCEMVDQLTIEVLETVQVTAESSLPCPGGRGRSSPSTRFFFYKKPLYKKVRLKNQQK